MSAADSSPWFSDCVERREVAGVEVPWRYGDPASECASVRTTASLSALPHAIALRITGENAGDVLDRVLPGEVFLREGQCRPGLFLGDDGAVKLDLYVLAEEDGYTLVGEGAVGAEKSLAQAIAAATQSGERADVTDLTASHTLLTLNGPFSWEVLAEVEGPELIAFPYLSFYKPDAGRTYLRAGKTGEFGYDLLVPRERAGDVWSEILARGRAFEIAVVGVGTLWQCALENWWFNAHAEGADAAGLDGARATPLDLQLQWRVNARKEVFAGAEALRARRDAGLKTRLTPVAAAGRVSVGDGVYFGEEKIGSIANAGYSTWAEGWVAAAMLDLRYAQSGISRYEARTTEGAVPLRTVSAPFVNNMSLVVSPQRHTFAERARIVPPPRSRF